MSLSIVIKMLQSVIDETENKNELSYFPDYLVTIPLELGWKDNYKVKDKLLDEALSTIVNFEGDSLEDAKEKSRKLLFKLKAKK